MLDDLLDAVGLWEPEPEWMAEAECRRLDLPLAERMELFFPQRGADVRPPRVVCARCPVATECGEHALEHMEKFGIWGGMSERERRRIRRDRNREAS